MSSKLINHRRAYLIWLAFLVVAIAPILAAANSPLLAWRDPVYVMAGFAGIFAMALLLAQPLLAIKQLPALSPRASLRAHRWIGVALVAAVLTHVVALWITSPPDVIDALLFASPTPFSIWGVIAMWALFAAAIVALLRRRLNLRHRTWLRSHTVLTSIVVAGSVAHAMLIEGTMETMTKTVLCVLVIAATVKALSVLKPWSSAGSLRR